MIEAKLVPLTYYVTFGQASIFRDNWVEVEAISEFDVRLWCNQELKRWAGIYLVNEFDPSLFREGKIGKTVRLGKDI